LTEQGIDINISNHVLLLILLVLIVSIAFFSASETGLMSLNRYRLKYLAKTNKHAKRAADLLARPDRLLAVISIGNNFASASASAIATVIGYQILGDIGVIVATGAITIVLLVFGEITPKTLAAVKPEQFAFAAAIPLQFLQKLLFPLIFLSNHLTSLILQIVGVNLKTRKSEPITPEELRIVVNEASGLVTNRHKAMLVSILDLDQITVNDIIIPRSEIQGINLDDSLEKIKLQLINAPFTLLPIYHSDLNHIEGIVHMRDINKLILSDELSVENLKSVARIPYFVPEGISLHTQLINFQLDKKRICLIVDEYGDLLGMVTLADILEEIVGEFTTDVSASNNAAAPQANGSFMVDGRASLRSLNRTMGWELPIGGAKTVSGLIIDHLGSIPENASSVMINGYNFTILQVHNKMVQTATIVPPAHKTP
jgi:Mg2+/Co2+ transporter CorB